MSDFQKQIDALIQSFTAEVAELARKQALESMTAALGGTVRFPRATPRALGKGEKRSAGELLALVEQLAVVISTSPGERIEQIGAAMEVPTKELALPVKKLMAEGRIRSEGNRRATRYFPGGTPVKAVKAKRKSRKKG